MKNNHPGIVEISDRSLPVIIGCESADFKITACVRVLNFSIIWANILSSNRSLKTDFEPEPLAYFIHPALHPPLDGQLASPLGFGCLASL